MRHRIVKSVSSSMCCSRRFAISSNSAVFLLIEIACGLVEVPQASSRRVSSFRTSRCRSSFSGSVGALRALCGQFKEFVELV